MDTYLIIIILAFILITIGFGIFIYKLKLNEKNKHSSSKTACPNHSDQSGETPCAICDKLFCESCSIFHHNVYFCPEHYKLLQDHEWAEVLRLNSSSEDPERGVKLYELRKALFQSENIPSYIQIDYQLREQAVCIETVLVLYGLKTDIPRLKEKFKLI